VSLGLERLTACFQGILPAMFFTCSKDGIPNAAFLSHVDYVDPTHVALSFQFFNKSRRNIAENPHAMVRVIDPDTNQGYVLRLTYIRSETSGPIFDRMFLRIEAIASYVGLKGIFKLKAADVYAVESIELTPEEPGRVERWAAPGQRQHDVVFTMKAMQELSARMTAAHNLNHLLDSILSGFKEFFGFSHSMILLAGVKPNVLVTIASRGYPQGGIGSEIQLGEGVIGVAAEAQQPIRISGLMRGMLYAAAAKKRAEDRGWRPQDAVRLPGMANPASQLGVPLVVRGELVGVLCIESETPYRFHEEDKNTIQLLGASLAIAIQNMQLREAEGKAEAETAVAPPAAAAASTTSSAATRKKREIAFYPAEEVVMLDGDYLIRSLPARILWKLLQTHKCEGRAEFTNRELRLDKSLNLPEFKDNLETRLLLLRRRLDEKSEDIRIVPVGRGRFVLELRSEFELVEKNEAAGRTGLVALMLEVVCDPDCLRNDGQPRVDRSRRREERRIHDVEVVDVVGLAVNVEHRLVRVGAEHQRAALVRGVLGSVRVLDHDPEPELAENVLHLLDQPVVRSQVVGFVVQLNAPVVAHGDAIVDLRQILRHGEPVHATGDPGVIGPERYLRHHRLRHDAVRTPL